MQTFPGSFKTNLQVVFGPSTEDAAKSTAAALGDAYTVFGVYRRDAEGFVVESECDFYVEYDPALAGDRIFGYKTEEFMARQYR